MVKQNMISVDPENKSDLNTPENGLPEEQNVYEEVLPSVDVVETPRILVSGPTVLPIQNMTSEYNTNAEIGEPSHRRSSLPIISTTHPEKIVTENFQPKNVKPDIYPYLTPFVKFSSQIINYFGFNNAFYVCLSITVLIILFYLVKSIGNFEKNTESKVLQSATLALLVCGMLNCFFITGCMLADESNIANALYLLHENVMGFFFCVNIMFVTHIITEYAINKYKEKAHLFMVILNVIGFILFCWSLLMVGIFTFNFFVLFASSIINLLFLSGILQLSWFEQRKVSEIFDE